MNRYWLIRMMRWARHPPSARLVRVVVAVVAVGLALYAVERFVGWPDWLTPDRGRVRPTLSAP